jgi:aryl-alcohol dehydrogenase-like predicted oxidoreductase
MSRSVRERRTLAGREVFPIGLGCMNLSHAYGVPPSPASARALLEAALELGIEHFDTAALYGFGRNEELLGEVLAPVRERIFLASKCGMTGVDGQRVIDGHPATLKRTCEEALQRLRTDHIDLYYLHRWDRRVPIEECIGALADLVRAGIIGGIGLSEVSSQTLRRAHAVHPIAAVQSEYSLWTRNPELGLLETCRQLGIAFVAFSPLGRGFLAGSVRDPQALVEKDLRRGMPRFQAPHFAQNLAVLDRFVQIATRAGCSPAQLALAWLLSRAPHVIPIVGTTSIDHLRDNLAAASLTLSPAVLSEADACINGATVSGPRYPAQTLAEIDSEEPPAREA